MSEVTYASFEVALEGRCQFHFRHVCAAEDRAVLFALVLLPPQTQQVQTQEGAMIDAEEPQEEAS